MAEITPWLCLERGALQAVPKAARAVSQLHSLWGQGSPSRSSSRVDSWGIFRRKPRTAFPARPAFPAILSTAKQSRLQHSPGRETGGLRGAVSYCRELGRHGRARALQQCPGLLQAGQHSPLPTAELGGAGTGAELPVLTQHSRNLICLIYSLGKKKINKWHLACPHVSLSQRRCQLNEPKPSG